ncbi:hypothetical protein EYF80_050458 [Liparis tanakae]|uniref:Uncharacterized protein n=1 Tax=Liparis tanakae TaxID=230148 RepID=A0A4Z2FG55_9TELE|nr:hypothetical protein EYF80_050458 [Liparis tanakae]
MTSSDPRGVVVQLLRRQLEPRHFAALLSSSSTSSSSSAALHAGRHHADPAAALLFGLMEKPRCRVETLLVVRGSPPPPPGPPPPGPAHACPKRAICCGTGIWESPAEVEVEMEEEEAGVRAAAAEEEEVEEEEVQCEEARRWLCRRDGRRPSMGMERRSGGGAFSCAWGKSCCQCCSPGGAPLQPGWSSASARVELRFSPGGAPLQPGWNSASARVELRWSRVVVFSLRTLRTNKPHRR